MHYFATDSDGPKTGDVGNHTLKVVEDGVVGAVAGTPSEVDATNAPGMYKVAITAAENTADVVTLCGKSSTSGVTISPMTWTNISNVSALDGVAVNDYTHTGKIVSSGTTAGELKLANLAGKTALSTVDNFYKGRNLIFMTGALAGQARLIESYTGSNKTVIVSLDCTAVPAADVEFMIT
jgi:hypothetical protein